MKFNKNGKMYDVATVSKITGISIVNLRNWEKRYSFLIPARNKHGIRLYSKEDVNLLRQVATLIDEGRRVGDIAEMLRKQTPLPPTIKSKVILAPEIRLQIHDYYQALLNYDLRKVEYLESVLSVGLSLVQKLDCVYEPILKQIGSDWAVGKIGVASEHFCSNYLRRRIGFYLAIQSINLSKNSPTILCCTLQGEQHEGGLLLISSYLKLRGWVVYYLGTEIPISELENCITKVKPDLVGISITNSKNLESSLPKLQKLEYPFIVGGQAIQNTESQKMKTGKIQFVHSYGISAADELENFYLMWGKFSHKR